MSGPGDTVMDLNKEVATSPAGQTAVPQMGDSKTPQDDETVEDRRESTDDEEEEVKSSAHLEPSTLPWPGDGDKKLPLDQKGAQSESRDTGFSGGSQDLLEEQSQAEGDNRGKAKWRESMPEGDRWRDDEILVQSDDKGDGSLADDEGGDEEENDGEWLSEKHSLGFTPHVEILSPSGKDPPEERRDFREEAELWEQQVERDSTSQYYSGWEEQDDKYYLWEHCCGEKLWLVAATLAGGLLFPLLVWGGYALLPFDPPEINSAPLRVMYTLRCSFFAIIPIMLGVMVQGVARLRFSSMKPLYQGNLANKEVLIHWHYVSESLSLFVFYFLQLAVMATYISQDLLKLVPLLSIVFVFGRLIYWLCLSLESAARGFGFGLSFFPILVMLGVNLYYVCSSGGQGAVFDVAPPTTSAPPRIRWWF